MFTYVWLVQKQKQKQIGASDPPLSPRVKTWAQFKST